MITFYLLCIASAFLSGFAASIVFVMVIGQDNTLKFHAETDDLRRRVREAEERARLYACLDDRRLEVLRRAQGELAKGVDAMTAFPLCPSCSQPMTAKVAIGLGGAVPVYHSCSECDGPLLFPLASAVTVPSPSRFAGSLASEAREGVSSRLDRAVMAEPLSVRSFSGAPSFRSADPRDNRSSLAKASAAVSSNVQVSKFPLSIFVVSVVRGQTRTGFSQDVGKSTQERGKFTRIRG